MTNIVKTNPHDAYCFVVNAGAIGDSIATMPSLRWAIKNIFTDGRYKVGLHKYTRELFQFIPEENVVYIGDQFTFNEPHNMLPLYDVVDTDKGPSADINPLRLSLVDYAAIKFLGRLLPETEKEYPKLDLTNVDISEYQLPEKYVCLLATQLHGNRSLTKHTLYRLTDYIISKGYTPVYMGKSTRIIDTYGSKERYGSYPPPIRSEVIDLVDKTDTLLKTAKVLDGAQVVVGMDTGLIHLAACTDTKIVCGYSTVSPELRVPHRPDNPVHIVVPDDETCRFCSSTLYYRANFNECLSGTLDCIDNMTARVFMSKLGPLL